MVRYNCKWLKHPHVLGQHAFFHCADLDVSPLWRERVAIRQRQWRKRGFLLTLLDDLMRGYFFEEKTLQQAWDNTHAEQELMIELQKISNERDL